MTRRASLGLLTAAAAAAGISFASAEVVTVRFDRPLSTAAPAALLSPYVGTPARGWPRGGRPGAVFGIIRPCRHRLGDLGAAWQAHLCGLCLSLRDDHGQAARLATNYDGLVISVLAEAQADGAPERRTAGPCALRGMRKAEVAVGDCARLAATVSLVLAAAKLRDHAEDGDGVAGRPGVRGTATALAARWAQAAARTGQQLGFEAGVLTEAVGRQAAVEAAAGPGTPLLTVTEPTETATAAAFAHTAVLAGQPANRAALAEAGRLFGRIAHLVDAVEDLAADERSGAWNPLLATGTDVSEARRLCEDALLGIKLALDETRFTDDRLVRALLVRELARSVRRVFGGGAGRCAHVREAAQAPTAESPASQAPASRPGLGLASLVSLAGLTSVLSIRHRRCCGCGEDCCCDCGCECCAEGCCEGCCEGCDCGEACCSGCDCG
jgi:hypothetical protein